MGQPTPPGDMPLFEGLGSEWNDVVSAFPEENRTELAGKLKARVDTYTSQAQPWEDFNKQGITPDQARQGLELFNVIENDPKRVYDLLGSHLGLTKAETKEVVETLQEGDEDDPRYAQLKSQFDAMAQIMLAKHQQETQSAEQQKQDKAIENELNGVRKKYGDDIDEEQILMRMLHKGLSAEDAYKEYTERDAQIKARRPAPMLLGSGGNVPSRAIDPTKLDRQDTKSLVAQMMQNAAAQGR